MKESKPYPQIEEENNGCQMLSEPAVALAEPRMQVLPDDVLYAYVEDGVLQVSPDIEEEIVEVERGETVSMTEFRNMFAKWL